MKNSCNFFFIFILIYFSIPFGKDFGGPSFAQNSNIDSLLSLIKKSKPDTNKVIHLNDLGREFELRGDYEKGLNYGTEALKLANKINFKKGIAQACNNIGNIYLDQTDNLKALDYYLKALKLDEEIKNKKGIANRLGNIGNVYKSQADYPQALAFYFKALKMAEELGDKNGVTRHLCNIGMVYKKQGNYSHALDSYFKALKMAEELGNKNYVAISLGNIGLVYYSQSDFPKALDYNFKALKLDEELKNKKGISRHLGNIGNIYNDEADYPKALDYYFKALKIAEELEDKNNISIWLGNIGNIYNNQTDYSKALDYYFKALKIAKKIGSKDLVATVLSNIGSVYTKAGKFNEAEEYLKRAIAMHDSIGSMNDLRQTEELLSQLYDTTGRHKDAFIHYKKAIALKDTIFSQENKKQLVRKEMNYEFDKKEAITKAENEKQSAVAEEKNRKQKIITWSVAIGLFLVMVFAGFIVRSLRITNKQKKIIESQNFQIVESINYSKKIQDSLLPSIESMQKIIPDLFVFYEPKAIVSGDFYYFKQFEKYTLLACVDCTGHGVPGGFMSTLGSLLLDKIANNEALSASEILNKLSDEIIRVLHQQDGGEIQDGMDLSICLIDRNNKKIEYSGARNGIIVVTNEQAKRYKADPLPVGGNYMRKGIAIERNFKTQHIPIDANDWIYMYTDGFMEQVGGSEGIPMNYSQFENQLIKVSKIESPEEKNKLLQIELDNWRGKHERDDDVLIMGFRVV